MPLQDGIYGIYGGCRVEMVYFVYVLQCRDGNLYIGQTQDLKARLQKHIESPTKQMRGLLPVEVVGSVECDTRAEAMALEGKLKKLKKREAVLKIIDGGCSSVG